MSSFWKVITIGVVHLFVISILYFLMLKFGVTEDLNISEALTNWDASWYQSIVQDGYQFLEDGQSNSGFFPGFPMLWKMLHASPLFMSLINYGLFIVGLAFMISHFKIEWKYSLFIFAVPSLFFFYVPYSEALNYFIGVGVLIALSKRVWSYFYLALFAICLIRPQLFFMLPAVVGMYVFQHASEFKIREFTISVLTIFMGTSLAFFVIGYLSGTNDFFIYSKAQVGNWNHDFRWPDFPFTTWRGYRVLWLDIVAFFVALIAAAYPLISLFKSVRLNRMIKVSGTEVFAAIALGMTLVLVTFFHLSEDGRTSVMSLNRYVFCNPFAHYLILKRLYSFREVNVSFKGMWVWCALIVITIFGFPYHEVVGLSLKNSILFLGGVSMILISGLFFLKKHSSILQLMLVLAVYGVGVLLQAYLFQSFLKGNWIG